MNISRLHTSNPVTRPLRKADRFSTRTQSCLTNWLLLPVVVVFWVFFFREALVSVLLRPRWCGVGSPGHSDLPQRAWEPSAQVHVDQTGSDQDEEARPGERWGLRGCVFVIYSLSSIRMTTAAASEPKQSIFKLIYFIDNQKKTLIVRIRKRMTIVSIQYALT